MRLAVLFAGNGFHGKEWWAKGEGREMELGKVLAPLGDFREKMLFIRGLYNEQAHEGEHPQLADGQPPLGRAAGLRRRDPLGHERRSVPRRRSTAVDQGAEPGAGCEKSNPSVHKNYSMLYSSHISWTSPTTPDAAGALPGPGLRSPLQGRGGAGRLERARRRAGATPNDLRRRVSTSDQLKLDEYLESVRDVERRIEQAPASGASCRAGGRHSTSPTSPGRPMASRRTSPTTCG